MVINVTFSLYCYIVEISYLNDHNYYLIFALNYLMDAMGKMLKVFVFISIDEDNYLVLDLFES